MLFDYVTSEEVADIRAHEHYERGLAEGRASGLAEGRAEMAKALKQNGVSLEIIAEASGLTKEQINEL